MYRAILFLFGLSAFASSHLPSLPTAPRWLLKEAPATKMTKTNRCDADVCFGGSGTRCPRVRCELCAKSVHAKCADIASTFVKSLREMPGMCWLCTKCRNVDNRKQSSTNPTLDLILQRTTSSLKLVGALVDSMKNFGKTSSQICFRPCCTAALRPTDVPAVDDSVGEVFNEQPDFTTLFQSILGEKRPRTSSVSQTSFQQPDKITKVDVPVSQNSETTTTNSSVSDARASTLAADTHSAPSATLAANHPPTPPVVDLELAVAEAIGNLLASTPSIASTFTDNDTTPAAELAAVPTAPLQSSASAAKLAASAAAQNASAQKVPAPTTHANSVAAQQAAAQAARTASAHALKQATALAVQQISQKLATAAEVRAAAQAAVSTTNEVSPAAQISNTHINDESMDTAHTESLLTPVATNLAVAPAPASSSSNLPAPPNPPQQNWYYVTRFLPHETPENLVKYVSSKTKCDATKIVCHKLVRQGSRQITFLSFKICVPQDFENAISEDSFWPAGVTIKPFLEERPRSTPNTRSRPQSRPRTALGSASTGRSVTPRPKISKINQHPQLPPQFYPSFPRPITQIAPTNFLPQPQHYPMLPHYQLYPPMLTSLGLSRS